MIETIVGRHSFLTYQRRTKEAFHGRAWIIDQIGALYGIEKKFHDATSMARYQARQQHNLPIMHTINAWLDQLKPRTLPKSLLGRAIHYALNQWDRLIVYLEDGRLATDNNIAKIAIMQLVLGRKAWLFPDRPEAAHNIAIMHSLVETAAANGLDPYRYLLHVFETMPTLKTSEELKQMLPWNVLLMDQTAPCSSPHETSSAAAREA
jgi:transposase